MMNEQVMDFNDIQAALAPTFAGKVVRVTWDAHIASFVAVSTSDTPERSHKRGTSSAKGIAHSHANLAMIPFEGESAWVEAAAKHERAIFEDTFKIYNEAFDEAYCYNMYEQAKFDADNADGVSIESLASELGVSLS